ncbi:hypothetical protein [Trebonia sp.]|nr:hypothetical protein [Trebonia sp.]
MLADRNGVPYPPIRRLGPMAHWPWKPRGDPGRLFTPFSIALA